MKKPIILRKRYIPDEIIDISEDQLLYRDGEVLITRWKTIRPRTDIAYGISYAFVNEGYKISRFFDADKNFVCWYCDIIDVIYESATDKYTLVDLLLDIRISPDGETEILDEEELGEALAYGLITGEQAEKAKMRLHKLLKMINSGNFPPEICEKEEYRRL